MADENDVTWLDDREEALIADIWLLSLTSGFAEKISDFNIIKEACKKPKMECIEVFRVCKLMTNEINKKS